MNIFSELLVKFFFLFSIFFLYSCEQGNPLNMEADILTINFVENILIQDIKVTSSTINIYLDTNIDLSKLTPIITISKGASIIPSSNIPQDFRNKVIYKVTSEDGNWTREYNIKIFSNFNWEEDFENWTCGYNEDFEVPLGWSSGDAGVAILNKFLPNYLKMHYLTYKSTNSYSGKYSAELKSQKGIGSEIVPSLMAGSIFIGNFNTIYAMSDRLKCPQFGAIFHYDGKREPDRLTGWIKYVPGEEYINQDGVLDKNCSDTCSFYAILFEGIEPLNAYNVQTSDRIIAKAIMNGQEAKNFYSYVDIPFEYSRPIPKNVPLQMTIVASSSKYGDIFSGAPNSTLNIDDVKIIFK